MKRHFDTLFRQKNDITWIQLFRYFYVAGIAFIVDFGSLYIFTEYFGIYYLISAAIAFIIGLMTNYLLSISWVFNRRHLKNKFSEFTLFSLIGIVGLMFNEILIWGFTDFVGFYYLFSKILSAIIIFFWNFFARKYALFR
jgi:putative flippase GtrA